MNYTNLFRPDINALRAIAVLGVVTFHYGVPGLGGGFVGVDIFFVISGFLISSHIARDLHLGRFSYQAFYISRLRRIFPALAVMCIACSLWGWIYLLPRDYLSNARHELYALLFVSNYAFTNERGYFDIASSSKPLLHTWSLSVEGQFYLFLPVFIATVWQFSRKNITAITFAAFSVSLAWCLYYSKIDAADAFYQLSTRAWEFLAGSLLALTSIRKHHVILANTGSLFGLAILLGSICLLNSSMPWPGYYTLLPVAGAVLLIFSGDALATRWLVNLWVLQRLGDISYSLYLWHWPILVLGKLYATARLDRELSQYELAALMLLSLVLGILSWKFVETPVRAKSGWWSSKRIWQGASVTLTCFIIFTITTAVTRGFTNRLPDYIQRELAAVNASMPRDECFRNNASEKKAPEQFCLFGAGIPEAKSQPSLILWGDSNANMYLSAIPEAATTVGQAGYIATQSGCRAILPDQLDYFKDSISSGCAKFNIEVNAFIDNTPSIHTIIIAQVWTDHSFNNTMLLIKHLVDKGKNVIVVGPIPFYTYSVPDHWIYQQIKEKRPIDFVSAPLSAQQHLSDLQILAKSQLSEHLASARVIWIDPLQKLCARNDCTLVNGGVCYYKDGSHLSNVGAMLLTSDFINAMKKSSELLFY
jgi:peptidoglycan/LPS O-acetylase OafA/YrhL